MGADGLHVSLTGRQSAQKAPHDVTVASKNTGTGADVQVESCTDECRGGLGGWWWGGRHRYPGDRWSAERARAHLDDLPAR